MDLNLIKETVEANADSWAYSSLPVASDAPGVDAIMGGERIEPACIFTGEWQNWFFGFGLEKVNKLLVRPFPVEGIMKPIAVRHE